MYSVAPTARKTNTFAAISSTVTSGNRWCGLSSRIGISANTCASSSGPAASILDGLPERARSTKKQPASSGLFDAVRKYIDSAVGYTEVPRERAEKVVKDLAARGEVRARDLGKAARELAERSERNRQELVRLVQKEIRRQVHSLGLATRQDVERLQKRIRDLEKKKGSSGSRSARATTRKGSTARKR